MLNGLRFNTLNKNSGYSEFSLANARDLQFATFNAGKFLLSSYDSFPDLVDGLCIPFSDTDERIPVPLPNHPHCFGLLVKHDGDLYYYIYDLLSRFPKTTNIRISIDNLRTAFVLQNGKILVVTNSVFIILNQDGSSYSVYDYPESDQSYDFVVKQSENGDIYVVQMYPTYDQYDNTLGYAAKVLNDKMECKRSFYIPEYDHYSTLLDFDFLDCDHILLHFGDEYSLVVLDMNNDECHTLTSEYYAGQRHHPRLFVDDGGEITFLIADGRYNNGDTAFVTFSSGEWNYSTISEIFPFNNFGVILPNGCFLSVVNEDGEGNETCIFNPSNSQTIYAGPLSFYADCPAVYILAGGSIIIYDKTATNGNFYFCAISDFFMNNVNSIYSNELLFSPYGFNGGPSMAMPF